MQNHFAVSARTETMRALGVVRVQICIAYIPYVPSMRWVGCKGESYLQIECFGNVKSEADSFSSDCTETHQHTTSAST